MTDLSNYSCDKCNREFSRFCSRCLHTADEPPTKFKPKKSTGCKTPEYGRTSPPPNPNLGWQPTKALGTKPPNTGSNVVKPNPNYTPPPTVKKNCAYETPCGWCTKWDKRCDKKIGDDTNTNVSKYKDPVLEYIKSGKGLPPLNTNIARGLERTRYD